MCWGTSGCFLCDDSNLVASWVDWGSGPWSLKVFWHGAPNLGLWIWGFWWGWLGVKGFGLLEMLEWVGLGEMACDWVFWDACFWGWHWSSKNGFRGDPAESV